MATLLSTAADSAVAASRQRQVDALKLHALDQKRGGVIDKGPSATEMLKRHQIPKIDKKLIPKTIRKIEKAPVSRVRSTPVDKISKNQEALNKIQLKSAELGDLDTLKRIRDLGGEATAGDVQNMALSLVKFEYNQKAAKDIRDRDKAVKVQNQKAQAQGLKARKAAIDLARDRVVFEGRTYTNQNFMDGKFREAQENQEKWQTYADSGNQFIRVDENDPVHDSILINPKHYEIIGKMEGLKEEDGSEIISRYELINAYGGHANFQKQIKNANDDYERALNAINFKHTDEELDTIQKNATDEFLETFNETSDIIDDMKAGNNPKETAAIVLALQGYRGKPIEKKVRRYLMNNGVNPDAVLDVYSHQKYLKTLEKTIKTTWDDNERLEEAKAKKRFLRDMVKPVPLLEDRY